MDPERSEYEEHEGLFGPYRPITDKDLNVHPDHVVNDHIPTRIYGPGSHQSGSVVVGT